MIFNGWMDGLFTFCNHLQFQGRWPWPWPFFEGAEGAEGEDQTEQ